MPAIVSKVDFGPQWLLDTHAKTGGVMPTLDEISADMTELTMREVECAMTSWESYFLARRINCERQRYRGPDKVAPGSGCLVCGSPYLAGTTFYDESPVPLCREHVAALRPMFNRMRDAPSPEHTKQVQNLRFALDQANLVCKSLRDDVARALRTAKDARRLKPDVHEAVRDLSKLAAKVADLTEKLTDDPDDDLEVE